VHDVFAAIMDRDISAQVDLDYLAAAAIAVAREIGEEMMERRPLDVAGATEFVVRFIMGGLNALPRRNA